MRFGELLIILLIVVLLFGKDRLSGIMGDLGKGLRSFKKALGEDESANPPAQPPAQTPPQNPAA